MSEAAQSLEAQIAQLEQKKKDHNKFSSELYIKLRKLKNELALANAKLWVVCCEHIEGTVMRVSIAGVSEAHEALEHRFAMRLCDNLVMLWPFGFDGNEKIFIYLAAGNHVRLMRTEELDGEKEHETHEFHAFDTHEKAIAFLNTFNANTRNDQQPL